MIHAFVKCRQAAHLVTLVSQCDTKKIVLQVDFFENATILSQNETQSAHWCCVQITVFTAYAWIEKDKTENIVLISDDLNHTKHSRYIHLYGIHNEAVDTGRYLSTLKTITKPHSAQDLVWVNSSLDICHLD